MERVAEAALCYDLRELPRGLSPVSLLGPHERLPSPAA